MSIDVEVGISPGPFNAISFGPITADETLITGKCVLRGWSMREASGAQPQYNRGSQTSPGATTTIATVTIPTAGTYDITWTVYLNGTLSASDANNFQLLHNASVVMTSLNQAAVGVYPQQTELVTCAAGDTITVESIAAGTVGAVYSADLSAIPDPFFGAAIEFHDGGNTIAASGMDYQDSDTQWFGTAGFQIRGDITVHIIAGTVTGAVYIELQD